MLNPIAPITHQEENYQLRQRVSDVPSAVNGPLEAELKAKTGYVKERALSEFISSNLDHTQKTTDTYVRDSNRIIPDGVIYKESKLHRIDKYKKAIQELSRPQHNVNLKTKLNKPIFNQEIINPDTGYAWLGVNVDKRV